MKLLMLNLNVASLGLECFIFSHFLLLLLIHMFILLVVEFSLQNWSFKCVIPFVHIFHSFMHLAFILGMLLKFILSNYELIVYLLILFQSLRMSFCYTCVLFLPLLFNPVFYHIGLKKMFLKMCFCFLMSE